MIADLIKKIFPPKDVVGIDIGSYSVKIVCFTEEKKELKLKDWGYIPLSFRSDVPPEERRLAIAQEIRTHLKKKGVSARYAAVSISGNAVIVRYVKFPKLSRKELDLTLSVEAEPFIPFDIKDVDLTCYILNDTVEEGQPKMDAVLVAAKKEAVADKLEIVSAAGLEPLVIDVDSFALETLYERLQPKPEGTVLMLNMGHKTTNLSIVSQGVTRVVRDIFIAGAAFDKAISKLLKTEPSVADVLKKSRGLLVTDEEKQAAVSDYDREGIAVSKAASGVLRDLYTEVSRSIDFYLSQGAENSVSRIMLSGGVANLGNIGKFLSSEFKVPVEIVNPFAFLGEQPMARNIPRETLPALSVAAGLALRRMKDWE